MSKPFRILAIESSCDETACAIVEKLPEEALVTVIASTTATSLSKHKVTQGIVPEVAAREQLKYILPVIQETLKKASVDAHSLDAIAVTVGPGLVGSLLVGIETAKALAFAWDLQIIPVNHIQAHPYANFVKQDLPQSPPQFPLLSWVISGGHTQLSYMESHEMVATLGRTVDDAAGECFDKCARVLGFDYPGGPFIDKLANAVASEESAFPSLPRPLFHAKTLNMSFSGLKTAFARSFKEHSETMPMEQLKPLLAHELQEAISDIVLKRTQQALENNPDVKSIIVSGGVAANSRIKEKLISKFSPALQVHFPPLSLCTDNAEMIGVWAIYHHTQQTSWQNIQLSLK